MRDNQIPKSKHRSNSHLLDQRWRSCHRRHVCPSSLKTAKSGNFQRAITKLTTNSTWLKTTDNCYIAQIHLEEPANKDILDNCGPIGFLQVNYTDTEAAPVEEDELIQKPASGQADLKGASWSQVKQRAASPEPEPEPEAAPAPIPEPLAEASGELHKRYLINITVGEDYAFCHRTPVGTAKVVKKYEFGTGVRMQCYENTGSTVANETYWYKTTDFCYVREVDFFESLFDREFFLPGLSGYGDANCGAEYRFPACSLFE